jgi:2-methylcitrate dehydratase PrpD
MSYALEDGLGSTGIVEVERRDGTRVEQRVDRALGTRANPMSAAQLMQKFADCARFAPRKVETERIVALVERLEALPELSGLIELL